MHKTVHSFFVWAKVANNPSRVEDGIEETDRLSEVTDSAAKVTDSPSGVKDRFEETDRLSEVTD